MYRLKVLDKTGFRNVTGNPVIILDERKQPFYDTREYVNRVWEFNLPPGEYWVERGKISPRVNPVEYPLIGLPRPERNKRANPEHFEILFDENPNKCTVDWLNRTITYDHYFRNAPLPAIVLIYFHECGHRYYETEEYCDRYAYNRMIEQGYNPSQIGLSFVETLSDNALPRKIDLVENIFDSQKNHFHKKGDSVFKRINHFEKEGIDFADTKPASYYIGSTLVAKQPIKVYKTPDIKSDIIAEYTTGKNVGIIQSYVVRDGNVWWDLNWFSGKHQGWTPAEQGKFDSKIAVKTSSGLEHEQEIEKMNELTKDKSLLDYLFGGLFGESSILGSTKSIISLVVIGLIIILIIKLSK